MYNYNYYELNKLLEHITLQHPNVNNVLFNKYSINSEGDTTYPCIVYQHTNTNVNNNIHTTSYNILYVDRLTRDRSNKLEIQSLGITVISELVNALHNQVDIDINTNLNFKVFNNQFADNCAGVIATVSINTASELGRCDWLCLDTNICKCK